MEWIANNWQELLAAITGVVTAASLIARLTPTKVDDEYVQKLISLVNFLAINKPVK
jgi:hypothetical protein